MAGGKCQAVKVIDSHTGGEPNRPDPLLLYPRPWPDPLFAVAYDSGLAVAVGWDGIYPR